MVIAQVPNASTVPIIPREALWAFRCALSAHHPRLLRDPQMEVANTRHGIDLAT